MTGVAADIEREEVPSLRRYLSAFWRWSWLLMIVAGLAGGLAHWASARSVPVYETRTTLLAADERMARLYAQLLKGCPVLGAARDRLGLSLTCADLARLISVEEVRDTPLIELTVHDTFGVHRVKLAAGAMVVYPSSSVHEVAPVMRGERIACFMFIESLVRDPLARRVLFDLDMALVELRAQLGETPPLVRLTGVYHNLLRRWAQG